jgi:hypothetical protein
MYLFDPELGEGRRAMLRDKIAGLPNDASRVAGDLAHRARSLADELESRAQEPKIEELTIPDTSGTVETY